MALNLLKNENTAKGGIHAESLQTGWNNDYLLIVLKSWYAVALHISVALDFKKGVG